MLRVNRSQLEGLPADVRAEVERQPAELEAVRDDNPLQGLRRNPAQVPFAAAGAP